MGRFLISGLYTRIVKFMGLPSSVLDLKILKDAHTKVMKQDANSLKIEDPSLLDLPRQTLIAFGLLVLLVLFMIWDQFFWWQTNDEYSFGYLVPLFAAYVAYDRWPLIRGFLFGSSDGGSDRAQKTQSNSFFVKFFEAVALIGFFSGLSLYFIGGLLRAVSGPQNPASLAISAGFAGILLCGIFIFFKRNAQGESLSLGERFAFVSLFIFPALIWLLSAPMVAVLQKAILVFLQSKVTFVVFTVFDAVGAHLERQGSVLILNGTESVGVEEACSGIRSLTACLFAGSFLASVFLQKFWKKLLLILTAMGLAVITNLMRALFLTYWAYNNGSDAINDHWVLPIIGDIGSVHDFTGFLILGVTCCGLMILLPIFNMSLSSKDDFEDDFDAEDSDSTSQSTE